MSKLAENFKLQSLNSLNKAQGLPSQVKGAGLRTLSRRGSWVQIPPPALWIYSSACLPYRQVLVYYYGIL